MLASNFVIERFIWWRLVIGFLPNDREVKIVFNMQIKCIKSAINDAVHDLKAKEL